MKISLTAIHKDRITELRAALEETRNEISGTRREYTKLEERASALKKEIAGLQNADAPDRKMATSLREATDELALVEEKIEGLDHAAMATTTPATARANGLMSEISREVTKALQPVMDARLDEVIKILRPLHIDDAVTRGAAWVTPYYFQLCGYCSRPYGRAIGAPMSHIKDCLAFCDEVLSGELKFSFDAKIK